MIIPKVKVMPYAFDLSKNSAYAFRHAMDMARRYGAEINVGRCYANTVGRRSLRHKACHGIFERSLPQVQVETDNRCHFSTRTKKTFQKDKDYK